ncbi:MAG: ADP-ribosyl-[dinitrogen reductase] hydrolase [Chthoniobacteraceae bacterium]
MSPEANHPILNPTVMDRALGAFFGVAIGDALGATVEFMTAREIACQYKVHNQIVGGGWLGIKAGRVTDDTEMALALGAALIESGGWDLCTIGNHFVKWMRSLPIDIGNTCRRGIRRFLLDGTVAAPPCDADGGNGAAMRNVATVLATLQSNELLIQRSIEQAHVTHNHPLSDAGTVALARMTRELILHGEEASCNQIAADLVQAHPAFRFKPWPGNSSGYIVDTVQTVFDGFFNTGSFEECVVRVVNRGGDADTTGAIAGQLAGALYGYMSIPNRWLKKIEPKVTAAIHSQVPQLLALSDQAF